MSPVWLCLCLPLLFAAARSLDKPSAAAEPLWTAEGAGPPGGPAPPPAEMLDLDWEQHRRLTRGAEDEEQQSTFGHSYENDSVTRPQPTSYDTATTTAAAGEEEEEEQGEEDERHRNGSHHPGRDPPGLFNPFYPLVESSYSAYAVLILAAVVLAVGVVANMAVMCIVWNNYFMRSAWNYLLASMAFWDFLVLVLCLPVVVLNQLTHRRILGDITCRMVPYMEVVSLGITSFTLCALGIDRFHAATSSSQPKARRVERCRSVLLKLAVVWLAALLLSSPELFLWQLSQAVSPASGRLHDSCTITPSSPLSLHLPDSLHSLLLRYHQGRMWWCFGCYFCLPVLFTLLCQMATRNVSSDSSGSAKQRGGGGGDERSANHKRQQHRAAERQLNCTLLALAVVYGVCALPEHVCNITLAYTHIDLAQDTAHMLTLLHHFLLFFKSSVTPVLLLCLCKALGQAFMDCCCCCCQECQPNAGHGSAGSPQLKLKATNEASIFLDKAKESSAILAVSS